MPNSTGFFFLLYLLEATACLAFHCWFVVHRFGQVQWVIIGDIVSQKFTIIAPALRVDFQWFCLGLFQVNLWLWVPFSPVLTHLWCLDGLPWLNVLFCLISILVFVLGFVDRDFRISWFFWLDCLRVWWVFSVDAYLFVFNLLKRPHFLGLVGFFWPKTAWRDHTFDGTLWIPGILKIFFFNIFHTGGDFGRFALI